MVLDPSPLHHTLEQDGGEFKDVSETTLPGSEACRRASEQFHHPLEADVYPADGPVVMDAKLG